MQYTSSLILCRVTIPVAGDISTTNCSYFSLPLDFSTLVPRSAHLALGVSGLPRLGFSSRCSGWRSKPPAPDGKFEIGLPGQAGGGISAGVTASLNARKSWLCAEPSSRSSATLTRPSPTANKPSPSWSDSDVSPSSLMCTGYVLYGFSISTLLGSSSSGSGSTSSH